MTPTRPCLALAILLAIPALPAAAAAQTGAAPQLEDLGDPAPPPDKAPPQIAEVDRDGLRAHAYWLADDERRGRYTGSAGQRATAEYVAAHFEQLGLKPLGDRRGYLQTYPLTATELGKGTQLSFGRTKITEQFAVLSAGDGKVSLSGKFLDCGGGRPDELPASCKGRIPLVVLDKQPPGAGASGDLQAIQRYVDIARQLANRDAKAAVVVLPGDAGTLGNTLNYHALQPDHPHLRFGAGGGRGKDLSIPLFVVGGESAAALLAHCKDNDKASGKLQILVKTSDKGSACNVVACLEGGDKDKEAVVVSAHHDHVGCRVDGDSFNGADDNASGTAGLLELASAFCSGPPPSRSIVFLSVSGEELGLWGSEYFADNPTWPLERIVADVNIDMIGRAKANGEHTEIQVTPSKDHEHYSSIGRTAAALAAQLHITFTSGDAYYQRSDHYNFAKKGIPVVFFCDGEHPDYHQVTDSADKLDYVRMEAVARLAFWTVWEVADAKDKPTRLGKQADW